MSNRTNNLWLALKRILHHLQVRKYLGICYDKSIGNLAMEVWSDASEEEDL